MRVFVALFLFVTLVFSGNVVTLSQDQPPAPFPLPDTYPPATVEIYEPDKVADGFIYMAAMRRRSNVDDGYLPFLMVLNNDGSPRFFQQAPPRRAYNFGRMPDGNLYFFRVRDNGIGMGAASDGEHYIIDEQGELIRTYRIEGNRTDFHEFYPLENGNVVLMSQPVRRFDLTAFGGHPEATIVEARVQEVTPDDEVVFEWRSGDHFTPGDTAARRLLQNEPPDPVPYIHLNAVTLDLDGNFIFSSRHLDAIFKVDRETGDVLWILGGPQAPLNEFTFIDDPFNGISSPHHPSVMPNGNILIFDNGNKREPRISRVVEYEVDRENKVARLVWSYTDERFAPTMGSVQRLDNGNTLIGWGSAPGPAVTEVTPDGEVVFSLSLPENQISYRAYRLPYGDTP